MKQNPKTQLQRQLWQFGLNPQDWILERGTGGAYAIKSRHDLETYFRGKTQKTRTRLKWDDLVIAL
jgi:hypothetical protein